MKTGASEAASGKPGAASAVAQLIGLSIVMGLLVGGYLSAIVLLAGAVFNS